MYERVTISILSNWLGCTEHTLTFSYTYWFISNLSAELKQQQVHHYHSTFIPVSTIKSQILLSPTSTAQIWIIRTVQSHCVLYWRWWGAFWFGKQQNFALIFPLMLCLILSKKLLRLYVSDVNKIIWKSNIVSQFNLLSGFIIRRVNIIFSAQSTCIPPKPLRIDKSG